jgi:hypothetical protein
MEQQILLNTVALSIKDPCSQLVLSIYLINLPARRDFRA